MADRLKQISGHLTASRPQGLLKDEVVIVTGKVHASGRLSFTDRALLGAAQVRHDNIMNK